MEAHLSHKPFAALHSKRNATSSGGFKALERKQEPDSRSDDVLPRGYAAAGTLLPRGNNCQLSSAFRLGSRSNFFINW
jgi:hypothetical protein